MLSINVQGKGMNPPDQIGTQRPVHRAMARQPAHVTQGRRADADVEMGLATLSPAAMTAVAFAVILDRQFARGEGGMKLLFYFITNQHCVRRSSSILLER
jgi:hypothetical protein